MQQTMFRWTLLNILLTFHCLSINNCISANSSLEILPAKKTINDDLIKLLNVTKTNDNTKEQEEDEEDKDEYAYGKDSKVENNKIEVRNNISQLGNNTIEVETKISQVGNNIIEVGKNTSQVGNNTFDLKAVACQLDIKLFGTFKPLLRNPQTRHMLLPDRPGTSVITLQPREHMDVDCPKSHLVIDARTIILREVADAVCIGRNLFRIGSSTANFATLRCADKVRSTARFMRSGCWNDQGREIEVGFLFKDGHFIQQYKTCFDQTTRKVFYSIFTLLHQIEDHEPLISQGNFDEGKFFKLRVTVTSLFVIARQRISINKQLGLPPASTKYINTKSSHLYLARGHLTPKGDFMYQVQQEATFFYTNTVPQWHTLNLFNWGALEKNIRAYATRTGLNLVIMTGAYETATLPHAATGQPVKLHMFIDRNLRAIPIPAQIWKVVYSRSTRAGIVFLGINNPYITDGPSQRICRDVFDELNWVTFDRMIIKHGYVYACTIPDLRRILPYIPDFPVRQMLK